MIQNRTTYYLGAGASYQALPLANSLKAELNSFLNLLDPLNGTSDILKFKYSEKLFSNYCKAIDGIDSFPTVDAFAKALHERGSRVENQRLGELVSLYFIFKQFDCTRLLKDSGKKMEDKDLRPFKGALDSRYLSFLSKVYSGGQINNNLNIISWNYDAQIEIALSKYLNRNFHEAFGLLNTYPNISRGNFIPTNKIHRFVKLNGTAGLWHGIYDSNFNSIHENTDLEILLKYAEEGKALQSTVSYAWNNSDLQKNAIIIANKILRETENLVIIGYSFPDFNWELDFEIFKEVSVRRIYVQVKENNFQQIKYKLKDLVKPNVSIELIPDLEEFYLPIHARKNRVQYVERMKLLKN